MRPELVLERRGGGKRAPRTLRRGTHLIPSLFTTANIFCGYVSIVLATTGQFELSSLLIGIAALLDALDGRVARLTGTTSDFGREFDSLADVISFGVAPAVLAWSWALSDFGRLGWAVSFLYVICGALRLARFNIQAATTDRRYFVGMPIPPAACTIAACVFNHPHSLEDPTLKLLSLSLVVVLALLMVSKARYRTFKELDLKARRPYVWVVPFAIVLALIATHPQIVLLIAAFIYLLSGLIPRKGASIRDESDPATAASPDPAGHDHAG
jgi:CDP-diacylglycerol---serine O-phosphatidyltransferase